VERSFRDKHSSLLQKFINYARKKFYKIGPNIMAKELTVKRVEGKMTVDKTTLKKLLQAK